MNKVLNVAPSFNITFSFPGVTKIPNASSFRILTLCILIFGFLIWVFYSSVLVAYLSVSLTPMPFKNLEDVPTKNTHQICVPAYTLATKFMVVFNESRVSKNMYLILPCISFVELALINFDWKLFARITSNKNYFWHIWIIGYLVNFY